MRRAKESVGRPRRRVLMAVCSARRPRSVAVREGANTEGKGRRRPRYPDSRSPDSTPPPSTSSIPPLVVLPSSGIASSGRTGKTPPSPPRRLDHVVCAAHADPTTTTYTRREPCEIRAPPASSSLIGVVAVAAQHASPSPPVSSEAVRTAQDAMASTGAFGPQRPERKAGIGTEERRSVASRTSS